MRVSNCCGAMIYQDICWECKEHCGSVCEMCDEAITEENESDNENRCNDCYEYWGDEWADR